MELDQNGKNMIRVSFILFIVLLGSCNRDFEALVEVDRIEQVDFERLANVHIRARTKKDGKNIAHYYEEEINGKSYRVANSKYYPYSALNADLRSALESYEEELMNKGNYNESVEKRSQSIFDLFSDINYSEIYGDTQYCKCIRFDYNENIHLYYFEDLTKVQCELTKSKLEKAQRVKEHWYLVVD